MTIIWKFGNVLMRSLKITLFFGVSMKKNTYPLWKFFKRIRRKKNETLAYVSKRVGVSLGYLSQFENGRGNIPIWKLSKYVLGYGFTDEEKEKLRQLIVPIAEEKPKYSNNTKELSLFHQLITLSQEAYGRVIDLVNGYNLLKEEKNKEAKD